MPERAVGILGISLLCAAGIGPAGATGGVPGPVPDLDPRRWIPNRKNLKLMVRSVELGVSAVAMLLSDFPDLEQVPPPRRGMYVGADPLAGDLSEVAAALDVATDPEGTLDLAAFAREGLPRIHPLWLVKGLSNNVLGFASLAHDFQGANANYCQGTTSGLAAVADGVHAVAEGRADLVVAGAADALLGAEVLFPGMPLGEGAAFLLLGPLGPRCPWRIRVGDGGDVLAPEIGRLGLLGVATWPVALGRALLAGRLPVTAREGGFAVTVAPA